jgi:hypothetical protein
MAEEIMLTVMVLTSDEAEFSAALSDPLTPQTDMEANITELYRRAAAPLKERPSLMFIFPPLSHAILPSRLVDVLDRESGGIPLFGTMAVDIVIKIRIPLSIFNGEGWQDRIPLLLITGIRDPKFFLLALPRQDLLQQQAVVTGVEGNRITALDRGPAINFLKKIGLIQGEGFLDVLYAFPLEVDFHDGKPPRTFTIYAIEPDGSLVCGDLVPIGSTISLRSVGSDLVLETASCIVDKIRDEWAKSKNYHGLLIFSCFSRNVVLSDPAEEMTSVHERLTDFPLPYLFLYSAGEYCPIHTENGPGVNGFYQYTIIACLF